MEYNFPYGKDFVKTSVLSKNKITKGNIIDLEDDINTIIDHQNIADDISISGSSGDSSFI